VQMMTGFGISGYRSFTYDRMDTWFPLAKVNLVAGQNNARKSNILGFIEGMTPIFNGANPPSTRLSDILDLPAGANPGGQPKFALATSLDDLQRSVEQAHAKRSVGIRGRTWATKSWLCSTGSFQDRPTSSGSAME
jgi:hypothetical protein